MLGFFVGQAEDGAQRQGVFLVLRSEGDELFDRLTKSWCSTITFIVQVGIFMHDVIAWCLLYNIGVYEDWESQISR